MPTFPKDIFASLIKVKKQIRPEKNIFYEYINFKDVIAHYFPGLPLTITIDYRDIEKKLRDTYGDARDCFAKQGVLKTFNFKDLKYYQEDTGISGPQYHRAEDPVSIIRFNNSLLLWEGYHRALMKMVNNETNILGFMLEI